MMRWQCNRIRSSSMSTGTMYWHVVLNHQSSHCWWICNVVSTWNNLVNHLHWFCSQQRSEDDVSQFDTRFTKQIPVDSPDDTTLSESANLIFQVSNGDTMKGKWLWDLWVFRESYIQLKGNKTIVDSLFVVDFYWFLDRFSSLVQSKFLS